MPFWRTRGDTHPRFSCRISRFMYISQWLTETIIKAAKSLEDARVAIYKFDEKVAECFEKSPIQEWEAEHWARGVKHRLLKIEDYFFRAGAGKRAPQSLFVRNENGMNVGLRREAITQMATYVSLITDFSFPRQQVRFESGWMDVVVFDPNNEVLIYAENKALEKTLVKLCSTLEKDFEERVPRIDLDNDLITKRHDDPLMKANHIWRHRPVYFWGVAPTYRQAYKVNYRASGFVLEERDAIPTIDQINWMPVAASF